MKSAPDRAQAIEKLRVQRHRLEGALERFYSHYLPGNPVSLEAAVMDVAIPIRVMVHHIPEKKPPSICLLHQIDPQHWKKLIHFEPVITPRPRALPSGVRTVSVTLPWKITIERGQSTSPATYKFTRYKEGPYSQARVPLTKWWLDPCWDSGSTMVSNKDLVITMANKEGGAHFDADTPAKYRVAKAQGAIAIGANPVSNIAKLGSLVAYAGGELLEYLDENFSECFPVEAAAAPAPQ
ncbi:MAG: hypothetical protein WBD67_04195 [Terracidiphilus sp.]